MVTMLFEKNQGYMKELGIDNRKESQGCKGINMSWGYQDYVPYTDACTHSWAGVITQKKLVQINDEETTSILNIAYISDTFVHSQKGATMTKEAYALYMAFKKLLDYFVCG